MDDKRIAEISKSVFPKGERLLYPQRTARAIKIALCEAAPAERKLEELREHARKEVRNAIDPSYRNAWRMVLELTAPNVD